MGTGEREERSNRCTTYTNALVKGKEGHPHNAPHLGRNLSIGSLLYTTQDPLSPFGGFCPPAGGDNLQAEQSAAVLAKTLLLAKLANFVLSLRACRSDFVAPPPPSMWRKKPPREMCLC